MNPLQELVSFMNPNQRIDLKAVALTEVLSKFAKKLRSLDKIDFFVDLTGSAEGKDVLLGFNELITAIFGLTLDSTPTIAKDAVLTLINLSADEAGAVKIFDISKSSQPIFDLVKVAVKCIIDPNSELADPWTMVLCNISRVERLVGLILDDLLEDEKNLSNLVKAFTNVDYNKNKSKLHYLGKLQNK